MSLRFELHLLTHAFKRDMNDPDRFSFHENNLEFYYNKYFRRALDPRQFGVNSVGELLRLVADTVDSSKNSVLIPHLSDDTPPENFVRLTEDGRRERQLGIDAGNETLVLKFIQTPSRDAPDRYSSRGSGGYQSTRGGYSGSQQQRYGGGGSGYSANSRGGGTGSTYQGRSYQSGGSSRYGGSSQGGGYHSGDKRAYGGGYSNAPAQQRARTSYNSGGGQYSSSGGGSRGYGRR